MFGSNCPRMSFFQNIFLALEVNMTVSISVPEVCNTGLNSTKMSLQL